MTRTRTLRTFAWMIVPGVSLLANPSAWADTPAPAKAPAPAAGDVKAWVDAKAAACQPTAAERRFDEIAWVTDVRTALELARKNDRPVFLFTHDGRMALGRC